MIPYYNYHGLVIFVSCSQKLAVNRASCALDAVYAKVQKYLAVHRDRSPPSPPSSLLVVSFGQSHFTSKHAQVTREKLFICF